ncbi:hypothetical protein CRM22_010953 [Opisthorchis felineus]|uniref:Carbonic anhydrase n=1 Tax=Opisthorchis felineus TaxID=147828 RepID=A0A4S2KH75_OPIFE|nr:hypothetical protein CRM22_010953 [Opisthorchis felineus]
MLPNDIAMHGSDSLMMQTILNDLYNSAAGFGMHFTHADCKWLLQYWMGSNPNIMLPDQPMGVAMHLLNSIGPSLVRGDLPVSQMSPIEKWVAMNGLASYRKHTLNLDVLHFPVVDPQVRKSNFNLKLSSLKDFEECDRLSQVNVVQQMTNFYCQPLLAERLRNGSFNVHGLWFQIHSGQLYMFSRDRQSFVPVTGDTLPDLVKELDSP